MCCLRVLTACVLFQTQNSVYEIVSDMSGRQDTLEERINSMEEKLQNIQEQMDLLPELLTRCIAQQAEKAEQRRNFLHPESAANLAPLTPSHALGPSGPMGPSTSGSGGSGSGGLGGGGVVATSGGPLGGPGSNSMSGFTGLGSGLGGHGPLSGPLAGPSGHLGTTTSSGAAGAGAGLGPGSLALPHSRSVPHSSAPHPWPVSPILPPISSRTPHLVPEPLKPWTLPDGNNPATSTS